MVGSAGDISNTAAAFADPIVDGAVMNWLMQLAAHPSVDLEGAESTK